MDMSRSDEGRPVPGAMSSWRRARVENDREEGLELAEPWGDLIASFITCGAVLAAALSSLRICRYHTNGQPCTSPWS